MKFKVLFIGSYLLICAGLFAAGTPDTRAMVVDWSSPEISVMNKGDAIEITLRTGGMAGKRLIQTQVQAFADYSFVTLTYQVIQNFEESYKHMEAFNVQWVIPKDEYEKLRKERKFYILRLDSAILRGDEVKEIKSNWKALP